MEHYVRLAQEVITACCDEHRARPRDYVADESGDLEPELVSRLLHHAHELGNSLAELMAWLENSPDRKAGRTGRRRGAERYCPRYPDKIR